MLEVQNVSVAYGNAAPVVHDFSMQVSKGEVVSIVGESGSGKSTAIRSIIGILPGQGKITQGNILLDGQSLLSYTEQQWQRLRGMRMSMIFQDSANSFNPIRRIGPIFVEYIQSHLAVPKKQAWDKAAEMLGKMGLPNCENIMRSYPFQLSGGMRQRVSIAMAMTFQPELLLADEPTSALDVTTQAQIVHQMMELRDNYGSGIIIVTHNLGVAAYMSDKIIVMKSGEVVESGARSDILGHPSEQYTKTLIASVPKLEDDNIANIAS